MLYFQRMHGLKVAFEKLFGEKNVSRYCKMLESDQPLASCHFSRFLISDCGSVCLGKSLVLVASMYLKKKACHGTAVLLIFLT